MCKKQRSLDQVAADLWKKEGRVSPLTVGAVVEHKSSTPARSPRILQHHIHQHDLSHGSSLLRKLEMSLDSETNNQLSLTLQFFRDLKLYGLREAIVYLEGYLNRPISTKFSDVCADITAKVKIKPTVFDDELDEEEASYLAEMFAPDSELNNPENA